MDDELGRIINRIYQAVKNKGRFPTYHDEVIGGLKRTWPTLWNAINDLIEYQEREGRQNRTGPCKRGNHELCYGINWCECDCHPRNQKGKKQ